MEPRFTFDRVAGLYDSVRAGYPAELFERLAARVPPHGRVLEVGCGTGKATVGLAERGLEIVALDPGASMIAEAQSHFAGYGALRFVHSTFEDWSADSDSFDMIASAQAWHWVPQDSGMAKAAALLKHGGVLAIFGNDWVIADPERRKCIDDIYARLAPELRNSPLSVWYHADGPIPATFAGNACFEDAEYISFEWGRTLATRDYVGLLETLSNHQGLTEDRRTDLLTAITATSSTFGDEVELRYTTHLHTVRRS